ncbi:DUF1178 family protein [Novosphingobium sp. SG707]|uniref:DUF1178 family protein n=1 Tax=Novosphingobium sp. SG707 TaxID=2586996 RepID=UPI001444EDEB|nr:DUF1178 family protein [Novosphingobium sp. SG707]
MIVFDLICRNHGHRFEGWFASSEDFSGQQQRGLVTCPQCDSHDVIKAPMAPRLNRKGNQQGAAVPVPAPAASPPPPVLPPEAREKLQAAFAAIAQAQAEAIKSSRWVGRNFVEDARAMHYGDKEPAPIHGQASLQDAKALVEEGVEIMPLLIPVAPPDEIN